MTERTTAEGLQDHIRGRLLAAFDGVASRDILIQLFGREPVEPYVMVPAVPEPLIVWVVSGSATVQERGIGEDWQTSLVNKGDFFLTMSAEPYEMRWRTSGTDPFVVMHLYLGLGLLESAVQETSGIANPVVRLREISGGTDPILSALLEQCHAELTARQTPSALYLKGVAHCMAVHLAREYLQASAARRPDNALPAFKLRRVISAMEQQLAQPFLLRELAERVQMSEYHFSRLFKRACGQSPSQYFIQLRMARARRLLSETDRSVIDIAMEVGYASPGHFSQVFKRATGVAPSHYRR